jgi:TetR/AcrR family transcriptional regulator
VARIASKSMAVARLEEDAGRLRGGERRRQLIEVAIRLFSQKGFRGTTTKEIALAAGITEGIIFRHFPTKDELYVAILDYKASQSPVDAWLDELGRLAAGRDDETLFRAVASRILAHHRKDRDFMRLMLYSALEGHDLARAFSEKQFKPLHDFLCDYIACRQRDGEFRRADASLAVCAFLAMPIHHGLMTWLLKFNPSKISDAEAAERFTQIFLKGLRQPARRAQRANPPLKTNKDSR